MSTPERPLTRRQLKELRMTGQLPVVVPGAAPVQQGEPVDADDTPAPSSEPRENPAAVSQTDPHDETPAEQSPRAAGGTAGPDASAATANAGSPASEPAASRPLTRRQARSLRTGATPVTGPGGTEPTDEAGPIELPTGFTDAMDVQDGAATTDRAEPRSATPVLPPRPAPAAPYPAPAAPAVPASASEAAQDDARRDTPKVGASFGAAVFQQAEERQRREREAAEREALQRRETKATTTVSTPEPTAVDDDDADAGEVFAEAFQRSLDAGGSTATGTSLILPDMPDTATLSAPITATGELLVTSSHALPSGLSTRGAAAGTTDGKDVDATLVDGEIPLHSSPTPIAASSAVSTSKAPGDVIRPPAPEKNHGLMLTLGITAGVLGVALVGVIVYAFVTGVFG